MSPAEMFRRERRMMRSMRNESTKAWRRTAVVGVALLALLGGLTTGCDDEVRKEFAAAAVDGIETGVNSIVDGVLTGIFTVAEPDAETTDTGGTGDTTQ
jgi:hypothetical protein